MKREPRHMPTTVRLTNWDTAVTADTRTTPSANSSVKAPLASVSAYPDRSPRRASATCSTRLS